MISNVFVDELDSKISGLTKKTNLFAESGIVGKCVFIKTDTYPVGSIVPDVRMTNARVYIKGYDVAEAIELGERMIPVLTTLKGEYTYGTEKYNIKAIDILTIPSVISFEENVVQFKFNAYYVKNS